MRESLRITVKPDGRYTLFRGEEPLIFGLEREVALRLAETYSVVIERAYSISMH
ncbi:hypothetical protein OPKNFCMD_3651 [Methylobacterium crusticola]|uniref:Uncharacterized protein n=1 Tax=Methylobacterium crusticola TaxID=1697972 RepID=A0ABQ4R2B0_9HYPH|nr:hypothetical protein [Methylobacterium crusticola]GJD50902.1 hypothetical protein OPKNFCMD_3651 [Methylobacterium crusticola]